MSWPGEHEPRLKVVDTVIEAWQGAWQHFTEMVRLVWLPAILLLAVEGFSQSNGAMSGEARTLEEFIEVWQEMRPDPLGNFLAFFANFILYPIIAVAWHRFVILGEERKGWFGLRYGAREFRFLLSYMVILAVWLPLVLLVSLPLLTGLAPFVVDSAGSTGALLQAFLLLLLFCGSLFLSIRLLLLLPSVAVDEPVAPRRILYLTRHAFWPLLGIHGLNLLFMSGLAVAGFAVLSVVSTVLAGITGDLEWIRPFSILPVFLLRLFYLITSVAILSIAYRELTQKPPAGSSGA